MDDRKIIPILPVPPAPRQLPGGVHMIENVQLELVEKAIYSKQYEIASQLLLVALRRLKQGALFVGYPLDARVQVQLHSRFCAAVISLFADPGFGISFEGFNHFASEHAILDLMFRASVFDTADHLLPVFSANPTEEDRSKLKIPEGTNLVKFMLVYSMRSGFNFAFADAFRREPQKMFALWAGMISPLLTVARIADERRETLLGLHEIFADVDVPDAVLGTLSDAYMYSSYGTRRDKHDMKATVHRIFANALQRRGVKIPGPDVMRRRRDGRPTPVTGGLKPTILICVEWFTSLHAMFRCYAPIIRQLRKRFRLVGMSQAVGIDEVAKLEFDEWIEVSNQHLIFADLVKTIVSDVRPDIIYYPSLGMAMWWVVLASVRLAPIQVMTLGHPASSRSPALDYVICEEDSIGDPSLFTEKIVTMPNASARFVMRADAAVARPAGPGEDTPQIVRIAVPAMLCKLNPRFMQVLRSISDEAAKLGQRTEFRFFVNMLGVNLFQAGREIRDWLPTSLIYERMGYEQYMRLLGECQLQLATFPFGGTNSNIDSMLLGLPILAMEGDQPHERFDASMIRRAGLGDEFVVSDVDEYVRRGTALVVGHAERNVARDKLLATDLDALFYGESEHADPFLHAMTTIYELHEHLQASGDRVFPTSPANNLGANAS